MENEKNENVDTQTTSDNAQKEQKTESKSEVEKTKQSVAKKSEDGSIVFKNQDELDGFINRMYAKGAEKAKKGQESEQVQETQKAEEQQSQNQPTQDYTDKIALAMAKAGVDAQKAERAARLVDISKVLENGTVDSKKLEDEINTVISEFPELKKAKEEEKEEKGFKFGATESSSNQSQEKKKSVPTKRWNRFNSI